MLLLYRRMELNIRKVQRPYPPNHDCLLALKLAYLCRPLGTRLTVECCRRNLKNQCKLRNGAAPNVLELDSEIFIYHDIYILLKCTKSGPRPSILRLGSRDGVHKTMVVKLCG